MLSTYTGHVGRRSYSEARALRREASRVARRSTTGFQDDRGDGVGMEGLVDLTDSVRLTCALLAKPLEWRARAVEQITVDRASFAMSRRSLQAQPLRPFVDALDLDRRRRRTCERASRARLVLPVGPMTKGPLLDFDVEGPEGRPAHLLQRGAIAYRERCLLEDYARTAGLPIPSNVVDVVEAIVGFTEGPWQAIGKRRWRGARRSLRAYLEQGIEPVPDAGTIDELVDLSLRSGRTLARLAVTDPLSATSLPALVVPQLLLNGVFSDLADATSALRSLAVFLEDMLAASDPVEPTAANDFLESFADYGRAFDAMVLVEVPLDDAFLMKTSERRPLGMRVVRNRAVQQIVIADARSNHVVLKMGDPSATLGKVEATGATNGLAVGAFTARRTQEVHSFYAYEPDRDYRVALEIKLRSPWNLRLVPYGLAMLLAAIAFVVWSEPPEDVALVSVAGPAALAASILLTREQTSLGRRLRRFSSVMVALALAAVVGVVAAVYLRR